MALGFQREDLRARAGHVWGLGHDRQRVGHPEGIRAPYIDFGCGHLVVKRPNRGCGSFTQGLAGPYPSRLPSQRYLQQFHNSVQRPDSDAMGIQVA
jgi:hypothetical protein